MHKEGIMTEKVFCEDCEYLVKPGPGEHTYRCCHADNIEREESITWLSKKVKVTKSYTRAPKEINKNNDCKWYKRDNSPGPATDDGAGH